MKPRRVGKRYAIVSFGICFAFIFSTLMFAMHGCEFEPPHLMGTRVSGTIAADATWDLAGSPYWVEGDVTVNKNVNLTIEPGVEVKFNGKYKLIMYGNLSARGTYSQDINFTSNSTSPKPGDWERIQIYTKGRCMMDFCSVDYGTGGIEFLSASRSIVGNSTIGFNSYHGVYMDTGANMNAVMNCTIMGNTFYGIDIYSSSLNNFTNCMISNSARTILLTSSQNNRFSNCTLLNTTYGFSASYSSHRNKIINCSFVSNTHGIGLSSSGYLLVSNSSFSNCTEGISLYKSQNNTIEYSEFKNCGDLSAGTGVGLLLSLSNENKVLNCRFERDTYGIRMTGSYNNTFSQTKILGGCIGLSLDGNSSFNVVSNSRIANSKCTAIPGIGISMEKAHNNTVTSCDISYNSDPSFKMGGICLNRSHNNTISNSLLCSNEDYGIKFIKCYGNRVFHNDLVGNTIQAWDSGNNSFNFTYPVGGNYWSDYGGPDNFHGPGQNISGGDGIGDFPRPVPGGIANDSYPLVNPINVQTMNCDLKPGWNLISVPLIVGGPPEQVLKSINGSYDIVQWYDPSDANAPWKTYHPEKPQYMNTLHMINNIQGLWLHTNISGSLMLTITGIVPMETSILLKPGWNLVGYPSNNNSRTVGECLTGIQYDRIQGFNETLQYRLQDLTSGDIMHPWSGYWLHLNSYYLWTVEW